MDKLLFWLGFGAAQKGAGSKPIEQRMGYFAGRRYFDCGVDNCRNVSSVGQPKTMRLGPPNRGPKLCLTPLLLCSQVDVSAEDAGQ
jgi:hypothetical protein